MQSEATGVVRTGAVEEKKPAPTKENFIYTGKHMNISVPGDFHEVSHNLPETGPLVESVYFAGGSDVLTEKIAITLEKREEQNFEASPSYQVRKNDSVYTEMKTNEGVFLEKKGSSYELSYFFWWEGYLTNLTYTAAQEKTTAKELLLEMQKSLQVPLIKEEK